MFKYPPELLRLMYKNIETADFVLSYPLEKDVWHFDDISNEIQSDEVPLFMQWDKRWGYKMYSDQMAAFSACGSVCLSMTTVYITGNPIFTPAYMIDFAIANGYSTQGNGSKHSLIYQGGVRLGLNVREITAVDEIENLLKKDNIIICLMGAGDFTAKGHFVLLCKWQMGNVKVNDPNSLKNSNTLWKWDRIKGQIRRSWVISK